MFDLIKKTRAFALLEQDIKKQRLAHAYMFVCPDSESLDTLEQLFLAQYLFGNTDSVTLSRVMEGRIADLVRLPRGEKVLVSDIEEMLDTVYFTPTENDRKFYIINKFETANPASQNKMLKILEEPPKSVMIILKSTTNTNVLPTISSRVRTIEIEPIDENVITDMLIEHFDETKKTFVASALSGGYPQRAMSIMRGKKEYEMFESVMQTMEEMKSSKQILPHSAKLVAYKDDLSKVIDIIEIILSDCMRVSTGAQTQLRLRASVREIMSLSKDYTAEVVLRLKEHLHHARERLKLNGNAQSILDELLFKMLEVKAQCRKL